MNKIIKRVLLINYLPSQRTSGGSEKLHGQEREIEQHRNQDPIDNHLSHRDRCKNGDYGDVLNSQRQGVRFHDNDDRIEVNDSVDEHLAGDVHHVDPERGHEGRDWEIQPGRVREPTDHRYVLGNATGDLTDGRK